jgi:hypothetical protein
MARAKRSGNGALEQSITNLNQAMATLIQTIADTNRDVAELRRQSQETEKRIEQRFVRIEAILLEHSRILTALPDAIRDKIGFKAPDQSPSKA